MKTFVFAVLLSSLATAQTGWTPVESKIPDIPVLDQDGRPMHFYRDLVQGQTVAIEFIFTTCTTVCRPLTATFRKVQKELGDAKAVRLISISVDPETDRPEVMKAYAGTFSAEPGWTFVTGEKAEIDRLRKALNAFSGEKADHTPMVLIGNDRTNRWTRASGFSKASALAGTIREAAAQKD